VRTEDVVDVEPTVRECQEVLLGAGLEEIRGIELFVIGAMATLDAPVVAFAAHGVTAELALQGLKVVVRQLGHMGRVIATELLSPVSLERDRGVDTESAQPAED